MIQRAMILLCLVGAIAWGQTTTAATAATSTTTAATTTATPKSDPWAPIRFMAGEWQGNASGEPGTGTASRRYEFVMNNRFLHERNTSTFPPQAKNPNGEVHEHWSFFSYDRKRKTLLFRQFHQESFVITYAMNASLCTPTKVVFESEQLENVPSTWKARETYERISDQEFVETFEIAQADQPFTVYSRNHFKRRQP